MSENKRVTIPFLEKVLKPIVDLIHTKANKSDIPEAETEDDALEMLTEMGILDPIQDEENNILTDEDGNIFTIE
jgi:hypothetical protein